MAYGIFNGGRQSIPEMPGYIEGGVTVAYYSSPLSNAGAAVAVDGRVALGCGAFFPHQVCFTALGTEDSGIDGCIVSAVLERDAAAIVTAPSHEGAHVGEVIARDASVEETATQCGGRAGGVSYEAARMGTAACDSGRYAAVFYQVGVSVRALDAAHKPRRVDAATDITCHMQVLDGSSVNLVERGGIFAAIQTGVYGMPATVKRAAKTYIHVVIAVRHGTAGTQMYLYVICQ